MKLNSRTAPKSFLSKTSSKLATALGTSLTNFGKILIILVQTRTMEQNKLLLKPFKQIFHRTDIKQNTVGISFITIDIPTINIFNSKLQIKDKNSKLKKTSLTFFKD